MADALPLVIVAHLIAIAAIVFLFVRRRVKLLVSFDVTRVPIDFAALSAFAKEKHERIGEYVRANWSGAPEQLPPVLDALLQEMERDAQGRNLHVDRETLKTLLESSLRAHKIGRSAERRDALRRIA